MRNDINVTPLVDVMLVLLIIFMLMTLIMGRGREVSLPKAHNFSSEKDKLQPVVSVDEKGDLWFEKTKIGPINTATLKELRDQVTAAWKAPKNPEGANRIYLKADNAVQYGTVYPLLKFLNNDMQMQSVDIAIAKDAEEK
ncbi:MAG TPA: biopolymer transporter ExbD [Kofleriaceae bacterium]